MKNLLILIIIINSSVLYAFGPNISGFLTFGASRTDAKEYYYYRNRINNKIDFLSDSIVGLNFTSRVSDSLSASIQLLYKNRLDKNDYYPKIEMAFLRYHIYRHLYVKVGKMKLPIWLISDYRNIGFLYPWVIPPEELYENMAPVEEITGLNVSCTFTLDPFEIELETIIGQGRIFLYFLKDFYNPVSGTIQNSYTIGTGNLRHANLSFIMDYLTFKFSYTYGTSSPDDFGYVESYNRQTGATKLSLTRFNDNHFLYEFYSAGLVGKVDNFEILSELGIVSYEKNGDQVISTMTEYITIIYNWGIFQPHFTLLYGKNAYKNPASFNINNDPDLAIISMNSPPSEAKMTTYTFGFNILLTDNSNLKLQIKRLNLYGSAPTGSLSSQSYEEKNPFNYYSISINSVF